MNNFICDHCHKEVTTSGNIGTHQRNHCPYCLYSKHVDQEKGDRKAMCYGLMKPIGLTFKHEGKEKVGELMLTHQCETCGKISINRLAGDDDAKQIMEVFETSLTLPESLQAAVAAQGIRLLNANDEKEIQTQLFGN